MRRALWCAGFVFAQAASAHAIGLSRGEYRVDGNALEASLVFARGEILSALPELDDNGDGALSEGELSTAAPRLRSFVASGLSVQNDGVSCPASLLGAELTEADGVALRVRIACTAAVHGLSIELPMLEAFPSGHRHLARIDSGARTVNGILYRGNARLETTVAVGQTVPISSAIRAFFVMGIEHILTGYDHLAFLFGLVLIGGSRRRLLALVTAFTVAHSLTLAIAATGLWSPSPRFVEPAIALSIAYVGVENWFIKNADHRWKLTFLFGLIHGFGFAGALKEVATGTAELATALVSFNAGVEVGQLSVLALILPLLALARRRAWFAHRGVQVLSGLVAILGAAWFVARVSAA